MKTINENMDEKKIEKYFELRQHFRELQVESLNKPDINKLPLYKMKCYACIHGGSDQGRNLIWCKERHSRVKSNEALLCEQYIQRIDKQPCAEHGKLCAYLQEEDYRSKRAWEELGYMIKEGEKGVIMHSAPCSKNCNSYYIAEYFLPEQVAKATYKSKCVTCSNVKGCDKYKMAQGNKKFPCDNYIKR